MLSAQAHCVKCTAGRSRRRGEDSEELARSRSRRQGIEAQQCRRLRRESSTGAAAGGESCHELMTVQYKLDQVHVSCRLSHPSLYPEALPPLSEPLER